MVLTQAGDSAKSMLEQAPESDRKQIVQEALTANPSWIPERSADKTKLWLALIVGAIVVAVVAMAAGVVLSLYGVGDMGVASWPIASAAMAGLIGLFAKSTTA